jgi:uncharacterized membrane protein HdeD (DUF308 family)
MTEIRRNGRVLFVLGAVMLAVGLVLTIGTAATAGIVVALVGFVVLVVGSVGVRQGTVADRARMPTPPDTPVRPRSTTS